MKNFASTNMCSHCQGPVVGYKCPGCKKEMADFDHDHWRNCPKGEKLKLKCQKCAQAEPNCTC